MLGLASVRKTVLVLTLAMAAFMPSARASSVLAGSDYLTTAAALFDFGPGVGVVALTGAFGPGVADTIVTRLRDADLPAVGSSDLVPIQMRLLELRSVAPAFVGVSFFDVFVHLDPTMRSLGSMTISHDFPYNGTPAAEGTFTSSLTVNFVADFVPTLGNPNPGMSASGSLALTTPGPLPWSHEPPPGALIVPGPPGDLDANLHAPLPPGFNDFFPLLIIEQHPGVGIHVAQLAVQGCVACPRDPIVPEPDTYVLAAFGIGLIAVRYVRRRPT